MQVIFGYSSGNHPTVYSTYMPSLETRTGYGLIDRKQASSVPFL